MEKKTGMNIHTQAVHAGDRKKAGPHVPVTVPIYLGTTYLYDEVETIDKIFGHEIHGYAYLRYSNPTNAALEEQITTLENGFGALACSSCMAALEVAIRAATLERRKSVLWAGAIYGATIKLLEQVLAPIGYEQFSVDICDLKAIETAIGEHKPGCLLMETISNPLLRVGAIDRIAEMARAAGTALIVDSTFATPLMVRPLELGAHIVVHSATKYLAGHGDVLGGLIVSDEGHFEIIRQMSNIYGPVLGPFESYLTMRGMKTFPLRMERQCANASRLAAWFATRPEIDRVHFPADPAHPDAGTIKRLFPPGLYGAIVSVELKGAERKEILAFMDRLRLVVRGTSLGDVHTMVLYPAISSHRDMGPEGRAAAGIRENLLRFSVGIEDMEDISADIAQALKRGQ